MGLLDDAIREHLELKRARGADPGEVERQEREALGSTPPQAEFAPAQEDDEEEREPTSTAEEAREPFNHEAIGSSDPETDPWLEEERDEVPAEESLAHPREQGDEEEPSEDVLEDTPDFLQETPEHDRLWFEQRPPRDFDWDK